MAFKARATRQDDGSYALSYGKGRKKLTALAVHDDASQRWTTDTLGESFKLFRDLKAAWGAWAASAYGGDANSAISKPATSATPPLSMPPRYKPKPVSNQEDEFLIRLADGLNAIEEWPRVVTVEWLLGVLHAQFQHQPAQPAASQGPETEPHTAETGGESKAATGDDSAA